MAILQTLSIEYFRNLAPLNAELSPQFNICYGNNGSGKTSFLEAIYYLGLGKSFRATQCTRIIQHTQELCRIVARITADTSMMLGIERQQNGERCIKLDGELQNSIVDITRRMPIQFMSPMSYRFFHDGPKLRRQYLDWALFHVEPSFLNTWQRFQRVLKQRNSALKLRQDLSVWDAEFISTATSLDQMRQSITTQLAPICQQQLQHLLPNFDFLLRYQRGWSNDATLSALLSSQQQRDRQLGYTFYGPQRADLQLLCNSIPIHDVLSQGQQKLAAYALHLALGLLLQQVTGIGPIYLIDDLPSELDADSRSKIIQTLAKLNAQVFITGISVQDLLELTAFNHTKMFHVEHGHLNLQSTSHSMRDSTGNQAVIAPSPSQKSPVNLIL